MAPRLTDIWETAAIVDADNPGCGLFRALAGTEDGPGWLVPQPRGRVVCRFKLLPALTGEASERMKTKIVFVTNPVQYRRSEACFGCQENRVTTPASRLNKITFSRGMNGLAGARLQSLVIGLLG